MSYITKKMFKWILVLTMVVFTVNNVYAQTNFIYGKQFGSDKDGVAYNPVTDQHGNVYIAGDTKGKLGGTYYGKTDGFITKFDSLGTIIWTKQIGTAEHDNISWLAMDKRGYLYATGYTKGIIDRKNHGNEDLIIVKVDTAGNVIWQRQFGSDSTDVGNMIYLDSLDNIYVSGSTKGTMGNLSLGKVDGIILKADNQGNLIWIRQFGTSEYDECLGLTGDRGDNVYVCGYTMGGLAGNNKGKTDAFVGQFTHKGEQVNLIQFGSEEMDVLSNIAVDRNRNIYAGGYTGGDFEGKHRGQGDGFLLKLNDQWKIQWMRQFGTSRWDGINGIALDERKTEHLIVSGCQNWPSCESFIRIYTQDGTLVSVNNFTAGGKNGGTCGKGVCIDYKGNVFHSGNTGGNLFKSIDKVEGHDIILIKLRVDHNNQLLK